MPFYKSLTGQLFQVNTKLHKKFAEEIIPRKDVKNVSIE